MAPPTMALHDSDTGEYSGPGEYPCVRRVRYRRLGTFLWLSGFRNTFTSLINETGAIFSVLHLRELVEEGLWDEALRYLSRFLPPTTHRLSDEAQVILHFLYMHKNLANIVAGNMGDNAVRHLTDRYKHYANHDSTVCYGVMLHADHVRALDWEQVRFKVADIVDKLAYKIPELKDQALMPAGPMMPQNVLPLGFGFRPRRRAKKQVWQPATALAEVYLEKKMRMSSDHQELRHGLPSKTRSWLADLMDESLKAGERPEHRQGRPLQLIRMEGPPFYKATFGTLPRPAGKSGISSVTDAGSASSQKSPAKTSEIASVKNAGRNKHLTQEGCYTESACDGSRPRKNPRTEVIVLKKFLDTKKQWTALAIREGSMASLVDVKVEAGWPAGTIVNSTA